MRALNNNSHYLTARRSVNLNHGSTVATLFDKWLAKRLTAPRLFLLVIAVVIITVQLANVSQAVPSRQGALILSTAKTKVDGDYDYEDEDDDNDDGYEDDDTFATQEEVALRELDYEQQQQQQELQKMTRTQVKKGLFSRLAGASTTATTATAPNDNNNQQPQKQISSSEIDEPTATIAFDPPPMDSTSIRSWGCALNMSPFIFTHIGKAGGGGVRARIAASALNYSRPEWHLQSKDESYYYPVYSNQGHLHQGKFVNSESNNFLPVQIKHEKDLLFHRTFQFEGMVPCHGKTPLSQAIDCPMEKDICQPLVDKRNGIKHSAKEKSSTPKRCDVVYLGHNLLGTELHWLTTDYLYQWWTSSPWAMNNNTNNNSNNHNDNDNSITNKIQNRNNHGHHVFDTKHRKNNPKRFCPNRETFSRYMYKRYYEKCLLPDQDDIDQLALQTVFPSYSNNNNNNNNNHNIPQAWPIYASLPVLRVTVLREPFSWLTSRFFWQVEHPGRNGLGLVKPYKGPKNTAAKERTTDKRQTQRQLRKQDTEKQQQQQQQQQDNVAKEVKCDDIDELSLGWASLAALEYIFYLCGEHCMAQYVALDDNKKEQQQAYIAVMEQQAAYNLRNSFAVVGLLEETQEFYDMISARVSYMDMSLNPHVKGKSHSSGKREEMRRCKEVYKDGAFKEKVMDKAPAIAALHRLYEIGVEVNAFQKKELQQCSR